MKRTPMPSRRKPLARAPFRSKGSLASQGAKQGKYPGPPGSDLRVNEAARPGQNRPKRVRAIPFPPAVAALLDTRDEWCQRCGTPGPLHRHHRRLKGDGGSRRAHTQCACNGLRLCAWNEKDGMGGCHKWVHDHPAQAMAEGFIVSQEVAQPGRVSVMRGSEDSGGQTMWPDCEGSWLSESPWTEEAA